MTAIKEKNPNEYPLYGTIFRTIFDSTFRASADPAPLSLAHSAFVLPIASSITGGNGTAIGEGGAGMRRTGCRTGPSRGNVKARGRGRIGPSPRDPRKFRRRGRDLLHLSVQRDGAARQRRRRAHLYFASRATAVSQERGLLKWGRKKKSTRANSSTVICFWMAREKVCIAKV